MYRGMKSIRNCSSLYQDGHSIVGNIFIFTMVYWIVIKLIFPPIKYFQFPFVIVIRLYHIIEPTL